MRSELLVAELKAQVLRVQECEAEIDRLHAEIEALRAALRACSISAQAAAAETQVDIHAMAIASMGMAPLARCVTLLRGVVDYLEARQRHEAVVIAKPPLLDEAEPMADAPDQGDMGWSVDLKGLRPQRAAISDSEDFPGAIRLQATCESGLHSASYVIHPRSRRLQRVTITVASTKLGFFRLRLFSGGASSWSLAFPVDLRRGDVGATVTAGSAPLVVPIVTRVDDTWLTISSTFPEPPSGEVTLALVLARDMTRKGPEFVGASGDSIDIREVAVELCG